MKTLPFEKVDPSKVTWAQVWIEAIGGLFVITLITASLWLMPVGLFIFVSSLLVSAVFLITRDVRRPKTRHQKSLEPLSENPVYWVRDSFRRPSSARELPLEMATRSVKKNSRPQPSPVGRQ